MLRGINREACFRSDKVKQVFMELLKEQQDKELISMLAWCVMDNHVHLLLKAETGNMSKAIQATALKFAAKYNAYNERSGPVFGDRYRSECIEDDTYLLGALRYIHCNPVKAGMVANCADYAWSSYSEYLTDEGRYLDKEQRQIVLGLFGGPREFAEFHAVADDAEYLEMREDILAARKERAFNLVEQYCSAKGVTDASQLLSSKRVFADICGLLTEEGKLTLRQVAEVLGTSHRRVFNALQDNA
jgi:REP element-mobilizing transposase RayT